MDDRHPSTHHLLSQFEWSHLPPHLRAVSQQCALVANTMVDHLDDGPELTAGLRKLLEAKDCFVRQAVADRRAASTTDGVEASGTPVAGGLIESLYLHDSAGNRVPLSEADAAKLAARPGLDIQQGVWKQ